MSLPHHPRRPPAQPSRRQGSWLAVLLASSVAVAALTVLFFITLQIAAVVAVVAVLIFLFGFLHYLLWGWWLGPQIREDALQDEAADEDVSER